MGKYFDSIESLFNHNQITWIYLSNPNKINSIEWLAEADRRVIQELQRLEEYTELLKQYRNALFERSKVITSAVYHPVLKFWRKKNYYDHKVSFFITVSECATDPGIAERMKLKEIFTGKERAKAFARFEELKKLYPNIRIEQNTEKESWENR